MIRRHCDNFEVGGKLRVTSLSKLFFKYLCCYILSSTFPGDSKYAFHFPYLTSAPGTGKQMGEPEISIKTAAECILNLSQNHCTSTLPPGGS